LLSIAAQNATLGDVLREVQKQTGATIDVPTGANDRIVVQLGPGAPREVLAALLNGTSFNYVMLGTPADPGAVSEVTLTARTGGAAAAGQVQTAVNTPPVPQTPAAFHPMPPFAARNLPNFPRGAVGAIGPGNGQQPAASDDDSSDDADSADDSDDSDQAQQAGQPAQGLQPPLGQQPDNGQDGNPPNAGPKSPEQILEMIRNGQRPGAPGMQPPPQQPEQ
ncbi:MAG: hypothetical protein ACRD3Q_19975, partial [Terriglobales bacterium]